MKQIPSIESKHRVSAYIFIGIMILFIGLLSYNIIDIYMIEEEPIKWLFLSLIIALFSAFAIVLTIRNTRIIKISPVEINIKWLFRKKTLNVSDEYIKGFYWDTMSAGSFFSYKQIVFIISGGKEISITDFGIRNFYEMEDFIVQHFSIIRPNGSVLSANEQHDQKIIWIKKFNKNQSKWIIIFSSIPFFLLTSILIIIAFDSYQNQQLSESLLVILLVSIFSYSVIFNKIKKEIKRIKMLNQKHWNDLS